MKKNYMKPVMKKVDFTFGNQVLAMGSGDIPTGGYWDPHESGECCNRQSNAYCKIIPTPTVDNDTRCLSTWSLR